MQASLADEGRLLITEQTADRRGSGECSRLAHDPERIDNLGQHPTRDTELAENVIVPVRGVEAHEAGDGGV